MTRSLASLPPPPPSCLMVLLYHEFTYRNHSRCINSSTGNRLRPDNYQPLHPLDLGMLFRGGGGVDVCFVLENILEVKVSHDPLSSACLTCSQASLPLALYQRSMKTPDILRSVPLIGPSMHRPILFQFGIDDDEPLEECTFLVVVIAPAKWSGQSRRHPICHQNDTWGITVRIRVWGLNNPPGVAEQSATA